MQNKKGKTKLGKAEEAFDYAKERLAEEIMNAGPNKIISYLCQMQIKAMNFSNGAIKNPPANEIQVLLSIIGAISELEWASDELNFEWTKLHPFENLN